MRKLLARLGTALAVAGGALAAIAFIGYVAEDSDGGAHRRLVRKDTPENDSSSRC